MGEEIFETQFKVAKSDASRQFIFGWANVSIDKSGRLIVDSHDDIIELSDLEDAAYDFVLNARETGDMHQGDAVGTMIESMVFTPDKLEALGLEGSDLPQGWWVGFHVEDAPTFDLVKTGARKMLSIQGTAIREEVPDGAQA